MMHSEEAHEFLEKIYSATDPTENRHEIVPDPCLRPFLAAQASAAPPAPKNARFETFAPAGGLEAALREARPRRFGARLGGLWVPMVAGHGPRLLLQPQP